jgi:hypothetical protein
MVTSREIIRTLVLAGALAAPACDRTPPSAPAPWQTVDRRFNGCAGG